MSPSAYPADLSRALDMDTRQQLLAEADSQLDEALYQAYEGDLSCPADLVISEALRVYYTHGQCHALALALHACYGYPLMGCAFAPVPDGEGGSLLAPDHVYVRVRPGLNLDICGTFEPGNHPDPDINSGDERLMSPQEVEALAGVCYDYPWEAAAELVAPAVVEQYVPYEPSQLAAAAA